MSSVRLFVSHAEADERLVRPLAEWLQFGLGLEEDDIRCTVVDGMSPGTVAQEVLRDDLESAKAVIGLITANSLRSHWVQLEMGAGWLRERLYPVRGPGIFPRDWDSPLTYFVSAGYCEEQSMRNLIRQLAGALGTTVHSEAGQKLEELVGSAQKDLVEDRGRWFSLPPVLSAWRLRGNLFELEARSLCTALGLDPTELRSCATANGVLTRDPEQLPMWALDLWTLSKNVVNFMLSGSRWDDPQKGLDVPSGLLDDTLIAEMNSAFGSKGDRPARVRQWFQDAREWIEANPPKAPAVHGRGAHGAVAHR